MEYVVGLITIGWVLRGWRMRNDNPILDEDNMLIRFGDLNFNVYNLPIHKLYFCKNDKSIEKINSVKGEEYFEDENEDSDDYHEVKSYLGVYPGIIHSPRDLKKYVPDYEHSLLYGKLWNPITDTSIPFVYSLVDYYDLEEKINNI
jgi:hypothetical protein